MKWVSGKQVYIRSAVFGTEPYRWSAGGRGRVLTFSMEGLLLIHLFDFRTLSALSPHPGIVLSKSP